MNIFVLQTKVKSFLFTMLGQNGQLFPKMGRHGDRTKAAVSAWLSEDFSVDTYTRHQIEEQVLNYAKMRNEDDGVVFSSGAKSFDQESHW